jgi:hypothetical protein
MNGNELERLKEILRGSKITLFTDTVLYIDAECRNEELTEELFEILTRIRDSNY